MEYSPKIYVYKRVVQAKLFIDNHFDEAIDLSNIADEAYFSKYHFIRLFKSIYQKTPHQYLMQVRVERAKELLKSGMPVSTACYRVGFDSISSFTNLFKRKTGTSPLSYQQKEVKRKHDLLFSPLNYIPNCFIENSEWKKIAILNNVAT